MQNKRAIAVILTLTAMLAAPAAHAHGLQSEGAGFLAGLSHPVLGVDHMLAMLAVSLWGAQQDRCHLWRLPLGFTAMMIVGAALALTGIALPAVETGIITSLVVLGLLLATAIRVSAPVSLALVGTFALFHGFAHAAAMPPLLPASSYIPGLLVTTAVLQWAGISLAREFRPTGGQRMLRWSGAAIAGVGVLLGT